MEIEQKVEISGVDLASGESYTKVICMAYGVPLEYIEDNRHMTYDVLTRLNDEMRSITPNEYARMYQGDWSACCTPSRNPITKGINVTEEFEELEVVPITGHPFSLDNSDLNLIY